MVEKGFLTLWSAIRAEAMQAIDQAIAQNPNYKVIVVEHSLGGSLATLAAADVRKRGHPATLYSFGSARVGNRAFAAHVTAQTGNYRISHTVDPIPKLPLVAMGYFHTSPEYWITAPDNTTVQTDEIEVLTGWLTGTGTVGQGFHPL
jgi:predicted lipase